MKNKKFWEALAIMVGYAIGVGMFGLPFITAQAGLASFIFFLLFLALVQYTLYLIYGNIIFSTKTAHRLPGYTAIYLGKKWKVVVFVARLIGNYGAMIAYIVITGIFLNELLSPYLGGSEFIYASLLFGLEAFVLFFGIGMLARVEIIMSFLLLLSVSLICLKGFNYVEISNFSVFDYKYLFLTYGGMLFALDSTGSLPMVAKIVDRDVDLFKKVMRLGIIIPVVVIFVFVITITGISGASTTPDALSGVKLILNDGVIFFSLIFGVLTMITSFLGAAQIIKETYWWDYKVNKHLSWALAVFVPYLLYAMGVNNLIGIISFGGAVAGGISGVVMILIFRELRRRGNKLILFSVSPGKYISYFLISMFILGVVYEIYSYIS